MDFSRLKLSVGGGMAIQQSVATRWHDLTGCNIIEGYGMTECSPLIAACPINVVKHNGTIGVPVPNTDIKIIKDDSSEAQLEKLESFGLKVNKSCVAIGNVLKRLLKCFKMVGWQRVISSLWMSYSLPYC